MNVFAYWIFLKSDQSCIWVLVVSFLTLSTIFFRNFELELLRVCGIFLSLFYHLTGPWYCPERYCLRLYGLFVRILEKHYRMKICSLMEIYCCWLLYSWMFCWHWSCCTLFWRWDGIINIGSLKKMSSVGITTFVLCPRAIIIYMYSETFLTWTLSKPKTCRNQRLCSHIYSKPM